MRYVRCLLAIPRGPLSERDMARKLLSDVEKKAI